MSSTTQPMTADELLRMPDDDFRYELIRGELIKMTPAGHHHGRIALKITIPLGNYVFMNQLGEVYAAETGFKIASNPDTVRAPDAAFVLRERVQQVECVEGFFPGAPDLAVEVISPSDASTEVEEKAIQWLDAGCRMVIVVDPSKRTVTVYRSRTDIVVLTENDALDGGDVVPGWTLPVKNIFALP